MDSTPENAVTAKDILNEGTQLKKQGQLAEAIKKYSTAIQIDPDYVLAWNQLSIIYEEQKEFGKAINCLQQMVELQPEVAGIQARLAGLMMENGMIEDGIVAYQKAIMLSNPPRSVYKEIALALAKTDNFSEAIRVYEQVSQLKSFQELNLNENPAKAFYSSLGKVIIQLSIKLERLHEAVICFSKASEVQPENFWHLYYLALALAHQDKLDEAVHYYKKAISIQPSFYQAYIALGDLFKKQGKKNKAFNKYIKALQINPYLRDINRLCNNWFDKYSNQCSQEELDRNIKKYQKIIAQVDITQSNPVHLYSHLGRALAKVGKISEAIEYNTKACHYNIKKFYPELANSDGNNKRNKPPDFIVIGVMKCGTSALYDYITQHPQVLPSLVKETHFFDKFFKDYRENKMNNGNLDIQLVDLCRDLYLSYFPKISSTNNFITGEATPGYITAPGVEELVSQFCPKTKLIVILRDPVKRAISQYYMSVRLEGQNVSLEKVIEAELEKMKKMDDVTREIEAKTRYLGKGLYVYYLEKWMKLLPRDNFLILSTEDLSEKPAVVMKQVFDFLGVQNYQHIQFIPKNKGNYSNKIDEDLLSRLYDFYRPHNYRLEKLLGRKLNWDLKQ